jgi:hypothetical protein
MVKKNMNEGKKGAEKNQRKNIRTQHWQQSIHLKPVSHVLHNWIIKEHIHYIKYDTESGQLTYSN